jgi:hypothetical protein
MNNEGVTILIGIIIILIVVSNVIYVINLTLPSTKYKKGKILLDKGNLIDAIKIFESIFNKHWEAPAYLAECKLKKGQQSKSKSETAAISYFNEVIDIRKRLPKAANKSSYALVEAKAYLELAQINYNNSIRGSSLDKKVEKLKENLSFIAKATKLGIENDFESLRKIHFSELAEINFTLGNQTEKWEKLEMAIQYYSFAKDFAFQGSNNKILHNSSARIGICKLKNNEHVESGIFESVNKSPIEYINDFYFRYVKKTLHEKQYEQAEKLISTYLNFSSPDIDKLKKLLLSKKIESAVNKINEINNSIDQLYEESFPVDQVKSLYETLDERIREINSVIPSLTDKLKQLKPSLFNRLLTHFISEEQFAGAINLIQKYPEFWESPELLKNMGICCYNIVDQGNLTDKNFRTIISNWITSVFSDRVILKSLEETTWEDDYTFTLSESIGSHKSQYIDLPENVNYDDISDTNISIGATQKELLQKFESLLQEKVLDNSLAKIINEFYFEEKEAVEKIVSIIEDNTLFASPYFAKLNGINEGIIEELEKDFYESENEDSLKAGIPYLKSNSKGEVCEYAKSKELVNNLVSAIQKEDLNEVKSIVAKSKESLINKYKTIKESIEDSIYNAFTTRIEDDDENESLIPLMEECIRFTKQNEKLKFQYSNYVTAKVNANEIDNFRALSLMKNAYLHLSENPRTCKNIITLIQYNLMDIKNDRTRNAPEIYKILDEIYPKRSNMFIQSTGELSDARTELLTQLKESGAPISLLTDEGSLSPPLVLASQRSLTPKGEIMKKMLSYLKKLSESSSTRTNPSDPLERLRQQLGII